MQKISLYHFTDLVMWGTVPLMGLLGYWEHHLSLSVANHKLVQIILVVIVFGWAYVWNSIGERDRLAHAIPRKANHLNTHPYIEPGRTGEPTFTPGHNGRHLPTKEDRGSEIEERFHVSNN